MGLISKLTGRISKRSADKRAKKNSVKQHHSFRSEYLLNDNTPFDVTEAFLNLKASLSVSLPKKDGGRAIVVTSGYPEDGKTTVTVNLALMFAFSDAKVILIDADIRKGRVSKYFKRKSSPGLSDYLSGQVSLDQVIHKSHSHENFSYMTCGTHAPKPYELLESAEMGKLIEQLRTEYDYIFLDSPPVLVISDALALAPITDGTVLVCRHNMSYVSDIARAINTLQFSKVNVLGVVVNDYKAPVTGKYYGGGYKKYYYYHAYGYAYQYGSTDPEFKSEQDDHMEDEEPQTDETDSSEE